jgi:hypothetical protein
LFGDVRDSSVNPIVLEDEPQRGGNPMHQLVKTTEKQDHKFGLRQTAYTYNINNTEYQKSLVDVEQNFRDFITNFCTTNINPLDNNCKIKVLINHTSFDQPVSSYYILKSQFDPEIIHAMFTMLYRVVNEQNKWN